MAAKSTSIIKLESGESILAIDLYGGAITHFSLKKTGINPLSFSFSKEQMPVNNKRGAPYKGHFLCLGRWGQPSAGEINAGLPNHGHFANIHWQLEKPYKKNALRMKAISLLEGLSVERKIVLDKSSPVFTVQEVIQNINPLGRLFNIVQHPTLAAPFLNERTVIDCNGTMGFDQALYREIEENTLQWPVANDDRQNRIDGRTPATPYNAVFSFLVDPGCEYGWVTSFSPEHDLLFGYTWKRSDYPWIHLWQQYAAGAIQYRGIEFGTAGLHQPFNEILNTSTILFGERTFAFIDAGEYISKRYCSFIYKTDRGFAGVQAIKIINNHILIQGKNGIDIHLKLSKELINELSK
jgi:hypothetical protein